ncbi:MAG: alpha-amylase [Anaerolineales bacterium]|nr:alpha-amylase [Anaerolineales bacterium]
MTVPDWVPDSVFYQIFPDRFANGDTSNDPPNVRPWGEKPTKWGFQGGDLQGVIQHFDYLLDLGVNAIYFNPIFLSTSNHRYNTVDYFLIDPKLGDMQTFHSLLDIAHQNGIRIVLDGVFNHSGRGFFAFNDILENQQHSPYLDWFHVRDMPLNAYELEKDFNYLAWWNIRSLPKFNTDNPSVREYLLSVARYWIEQGIDGWRLDVPNEIDDDTFWAEFRAIVKEINPQAYLLGEIWEVNPRWIGASHFDGLMNYPMRDAVLDFLAKGLTTPSVFDQQIRALLDAYPEEHTFSHYLPLGTHDTKRLRTQCGEDGRRVRQTFLFQFTYPGAPAIYYGDEIGLAGGKDPACRGAFPMNKASWDQDLRAYVKKLVHLRGEFTALRRGVFKTLKIDDGAGIYAFYRVLDSNVVAVVLNASDQEQFVVLPIADLGWEDGWTINEAIGEQDVIVSQSEVRLKLTSRAGALLHPSN